MPEWQGFQRPSLMNITWQDCLKAVDAWLETINNMIHYYPEDIEQWQCKLAIALEKRQEIAMLAEGETL
jgi:hypothetical protein